MGRTLLCGNAHPRQANDKQDLRQHKIRQPELFFEDGTLLLDAAFVVGEIAAR